MTSILWFALGRFVSKYAQELQISNPREFSVDSRAGDMFQQVFELVRACGQTLFVAVDDYDSPVVNLSPPLPNQTASPREIEALFESSFWRPLLQGSDVIDKLVVAGVHFVTSPALQKLGLKITADLQTSSESSLPDEVSIEGLIQLLATGAVDCDIHTPVDLDAKAVHSRVDTIFADRHELQLNFHGPWFEFTHETDSDAEDFIELLSAVLCGQAQRSFGNKREPNLHGILELVNLKDLHEELIDLDEEDLLKQPYAPTPDSTETVLVGSFVNPEPPHTQLVATIIPPLPQARVGWRDLVVAWTVEDEHSPFCRGRRTNHYFLQLPIATSLSTMDRKTSPPWVHQRGQIVPLLSGALPSSSWTAALTKKMKGYCLGHFLGVDKDEYSFCLGGRRTNHWYFQFHVLARPASTIPPPWVHQRGQIVPLLSGTLPSSSLTVGEVLGSRGPQKIPFKQAALTKNMKGNFGAAF
ncbi:hypothetical protein C8R46DRAFT_1222157 [Mycena filopes]|nr:hypothetical protein C8R46DRAFT_1222157 [Mycena filopes]